MKKTFESECEKLRYRALRDGSGSSADMTWRNHAKSCPECQASLHIFELLNSHDDNGAFKLSPKDADKLVEKARERYGVRSPKPFWARLAGYAGKAAAVAVIAFSFSQLSSRFSVMGWMIDKSVNVVADTVMSVATPEAHATMDETPMSRNLVTPAASAIYNQDAPLAEHTGNEAIVAKATVEGTMSGLSLQDSLDIAIGDVAKRIEAQRDDIGSLIDADYNFY